MYEIIGTFIGGITTGLGIAYAYWKSIPMEKKKSAIASIAEAMGDGKLTPSEAMDAILELM